MKKLVPQILAAALVLLGSVAAGAQTTARKPAAAAQAQQAAVKADVENLRAALNGLPAEEAFITALSPSNVALYHRNEYYKTEEEYLFALADAMHEEYQAIVDAGFVLQIDDPRFATHYDRYPELSVDECRAFIALCVEVINHALIETVEL